VKLERAIEVAKAADLKGEEKIAVHVLVQLAKRVVATRRAIRALATAVDPETDLNQDALFEEW
jgi:hypothetical protein